MRRADFSWWDYRAGMFHRNEGMRIDLLYATDPVAKRIVWSEIDREARKGPPIPSDHAPVVIDLDEQGQGVRRRLGRGDGADRGPDAAGQPQEPGPGPVRRGARGEEALELTSAAARGRRASADDHDPRHPAHEPGRRPDVQHPVLLADDLDLVAPVEPADLARTGGRRGRPTPDEAIARSSGARRSIRRRRRNFAGARPVSVCHGGGASGPGGGGIGERARAGRPRTRAPRSVPRPRHHDDDVARPSPPSASEREHAPRPPRPSPRPRCPVRCRVPSRG